MSSPTKIVFMLTALTAFTLSAQTATNQHVPPTPAQMVSSKIGRLTTLLSLTTDQQTQATTIFTTEETALAAARSSMHSDRTALQTAVTANDAAGIATAASQIGSLTTQEVQVRGTADAAFYALLTADQQAKFAQLNAGGPHGGPGGFGGPGPGGFHP